MTGAEILLWLVLLIAVGGPVPDRQALPSCPIGADRLIEIHPDGRTATVYRCTRE